MLPRVWKVERLWRNESSALPESFFIFPTASGVGLHGQHSGWPDSCKRPLRVPWAVGREMLRDAAFATLLEGAGLTFRPSAVEPVDMRADQQREAVWICASL